MTARLAHDWRHVLERRPGPVAWPEAAALVGLVVWQAWAYRQSRRHYLRLPAVPALGPSAKSGYQGALPISIVIPARNEQRNLPQLLQSLAAQDPPARQIIVVDDRSSDRTAAIAADAGASVVRSPGPPPGWTGKNYACHLGAGAAVQPWLLFLDADTSVAPRGLLSALEFTTNHTLDALSLLLAQRCVTFWERLLLPYAYALYFIGAGPGAPLANGQWILISIEAYQRCGGHSGVRGSIIDDIALARACRAAGVRLQAARGEHLAAVRMYSDLPSIWEGFAKNAFQFVAARPASGMVTVGGAMAGAALPALLWRAWRRGGLLRWCIPLASYGMGVYGLGFWQREFRAGRLGAPMYPLAAAMFQAIAVYSTARVASRRGVTWKGRTYR